MSTQPAFRIHITGCSPRSGTTLMAEAMKICFEIDYSTDHEDRIYRHQHGAGNIFLTKEPRDTLVIEPFLRVMPNLYVVYMIRDPRDIIVSKHNSRPDKYWCSLWYWNTFNRYYQRIKKHSRVIPVRYEDLVNDPDAIQAMLMDRMPFLQKRHPFSKYHKHTQPSTDSVDALRGVRPITTASIGNWKNHLERVKGQILKHGNILEDLIEFGYEKDNRWLKLLDGISPDLSGSAIPETGNLYEMTRGKYREALKYYLSQQGCGIHHLAKLF